MYYEQSDYLYSSLNIIRMIITRRIKWEGHVPRMGEIRNPYKISVGKPEGKRELGRPWCRWKSNVKTDIKGTGNERVG
jgi:hypothetical protein